MRIGKYTTTEYQISVCGRPLRLLGPVNPYSLFGEIEVEERFEKDGYSPYWATPWPGSLMLAEYLARMDAPGDWPMLELGAGLGLSALGAAMYGCRVIATDYDETALDFIRASAALNELTLEDVRFLDWRRPPRAAFQTILGADILYEKANQGPILKLISQCLTAGGTAMISDPNRADADNLDPLVTAAGLALSMVPVSCQCLPTAEEDEDRQISGRIFLIRHAK